MSLSENSTETASNIFQKIAGFQAVIPQFDNISAITPKFFIDNVETITTLAKCSEDEKLLVLKSRIRGDALYSVINSPDLAQEKNYVEFKRKFLAFFDTKISLATRQQLFSNCKMLMNEPVKIYAARVAMATQRFFNAPDLTNAAVKDLFEKSKLSKFLEGLLPSYKHSALMKDPQTFQEAIDFVELLQTNEASLNSDYERSLDPLVGKIDSSAKQITNDEIKQLIELQSAKTQQIVEGLTKEVENLKINTFQNSIPQNSERYNQSNRASYFTNIQRQNSRNNNASRFFPSCQFCGKTNHLSQNCFQHPNKRRGGFLPQHSPRARGFERKTFSTSRPYNNKSDRNLN